MRVGSQPQKKALARVKSHTHHSLFSNSNSKSSFSRQSILKAPLVADAGESIHNTLASLYYCSVEVLRPVLAYPGKTRLARCVFALKKKALWLFLLSHSLCCQSLFGRASRAIRFPMAGSRREFSIETIHASIYYGALGSTF